MTRKFYLPLVLLMVFSMLLSACAPAVATEVAAPPTTAPLVEVPPTPAPPTELPAPDIAVLYNAVVTSLPEGFGGLKPVDVSKAMADANPPFLLDVREPAEIEKDGYIKGAVNIPVRNAIKNLDKLPGLDSKIIVYCGSGQRGGMLMGGLRLLGYTQVYNLGGGLNAWKKANLPVETGSKPAEVKVLGTPLVADKALFDMVDTFFSTLPDGFLALKADKVAEQLNSATPPVLIDLRSPEEIKSGGYIKGSVNIPVGKLFTSLDQLPAKDAPFILYCGSGLRGSIALPGLRMLGYTKVISLGGGLGAWKAANLPVEGIVNWTSVWTDFTKNMPADFYTVKADVLGGQIKAGNAPFIIDVREPAELEKTGFIKGAVNLPIRTLLQNLDKLPALDKPVVVYCTIGHRGAMAMSALRLLGYDARSIGGGLNAWLKAKQPVEKGKPAGPVAGTAAAVDPLRLKDLDAFLSTLPDNFDGVKDTDALAALSSATPPTLIDVRGPDEVKTNGYIKGSVFLPVNDLLADMTRLPADKNAAVITVCSAGHRGAVATMALRMLGYTKSVSIFGGTGAWKADKLPLER
ncbi:MAG TPA: rhodanese-like domain-containing protein [Anaerolineales bacterium]|jgi:rhodanese-related sulfurtransferase